MRTSLFRSISTAALASFVVASASSCEDGFPRGDDDLLEGDPLVEGDPLREGDPLTDEGLGEARSGLTKGRDGAVNGASDYCNDPANLCVAGEGDCDRASQCTTNYCGTNNGPAFGMPADYDVCVPATCQNGARDGDETGVDCGGTCGECACGGEPGTGSYCTTSCPCDTGGGDCDSNAQCTTGYCGRDNGPAFGMPADYDVCVPATCQNGVRDGDETAVDCGGTCGACACDGVPGTASYCTASCPCDTGGGDCDSNAQCTTGYCGRDNGPKFGMPADYDVCVPATCQDGTQNGDETAVDCGGSCGACVCGGVPGTASFCTVECPCDAGGGDCDSDAQCATGACGTNNGAQFGMPADYDVCIPATCEDGVQSADEDGVDCGGFCAPCQEPTATCDDGIQNQGEEGVDCGGPCAACETFCTPAETQSCYSGPAGTEGVGSCSAGTATCNAEGTAFGECTGEVLPAAEDCATPEDEDCDGATPPCAAGEWSHAFGGTGSDVGQGIAVDADGNVLVAGAFAGVADFGGGALTSAGSSDVFVAKFDADGNHLWSRRFGSAGADVALGVATDATGSVIVTGYVTGNVDFGGGTLPSAGDTDVFIAKLDANGGHVWSRRFGGADADLAYDVAADPEGNVVVTGTYSGLEPVSFGGEALLRLGGSSAITDVFVAKYNPAGEHVWSRGFGGASAEYARGIAADADGNVVVTGYFQSSASFGGSVLTSAGAYDVFVAKLDPAGAHVWSAPFGGEGSDFGWSVATDGAGNVLLGGQFQLTAAFGGASLTSAGSADAFVAKLDPAGAHVWSSRFGSTGLDRAFAVAADTSGGVLATGAFNGSAAFGATTLSSAGADDVFVAVLGPSGAATSARRFGGPTADYGRAIAVAAEDVLLTGDFTTSIDFGHGALTSAGDRDIFLARVAR